MAFDPRGLLSKLKTYYHKLQHKTNQLISFAKEKNIFKHARLTYKVAWNFFLIFLVVGLMGAFFIGGAGAGYFASLVKDQKVLSKETMKASIYNYTETSEIYFANNVYLGKMPSDLQREEVELNEISDYVIHALIATEDQYFYKHEGVVPKAIMRALYQQVTNAPLETGGSTLTQQLVKNQILTPEVSFERKAKEMLYAMRLEQFFKKEEILEAYLNVVPFGRNASGENIAGIQAAAQGVFGVDADELSLPQAAYLAGMPKNPFTYTPFKNSGGVKENIKPGIERMHTVLSRMLSVGYITKEQYEKAMAYDIKKHLTKPKEQPLAKYPAFTMEVKRRATKILAIHLADKQGHNGKQLAKASHLIDKSNDYSSGLYGKHDMEKLKKQADIFNRFKEIANRQISRNGYEIHTTINKKIHTAWQKVVDNYDNWDAVKTVTDTNEKTGKKITRKYIHQVGSMLIDNNTGRIISFVGGRNYDKLNYNLATQARRDNGSTAKPLVTYAPAMEMGIAQPGYIVADLPVVFEQYGGWDPGNYAGGYHGLETIRTALKFSHNVPAIKTYLKMDPESARATSYLKKMGVTSMSADDRTNPSMAIGSWNRGITVEENTNAHGTFANGGIFVDAYMIEKIVTSDGEIIYEHQTEKTKVFSPQTAYLMIDMMRDVINSGTAAGLPYKLNFSTDWAGKTGTSQNYGDSWFVATNPNVTLGVWNGYVRRLEQDHYGSFNYADRTQQLWARFANAAYKIKPELMDPDKRFNMPSGIVSRSVCGITGMLPTDLCREAGLVVSDIFNAKYAPDSTGDALREGRYVVVDGESYRALKSTPKEFTKEGVLLKEEFFKEHFIDVTVEELMKYMPEDWKTVVPDQKMKENGTVPAKVTGVRINGGTLEWTSHPESDIVGYRVYQLAGNGKFTEVAAIPSFKDNRYKVQPGTLYYVTAVDIAGQESAPSKKVGKKPEPKPVAMRIVLRGNNIVWAKPEKDIVQYRVYNTSTGKLTKLPGSARSYNVKGKPGTYYVTSIDDAGQESPPSNKVIVPPKKKPASEEEEKKTESQ